MAASGIRKGALQRLGVEVKCYLNDERVAEMATSKGITRTQAASAWLWKNIPMHSLSLVMPPQH